MQHGALMGLPSRWLVTLPLSNAWAGIRVRVFGIKANGVQVLLVLLVSSKKMFNIYFRYNISFKYRRMSFYLSVSCCSTIDLMKSLQIAALNCRLPNASLRPEIPRHSNHNISE